jgi:Domain of unknown function (DUF397)
MPILLQMRVQLQMHRGKLERGQFGGPASTSRPLPQQPATAARFLPTARKRPHRQHQHADLTSQPSETAQRNSPAKPSKGNTMHNIRNGMPASDLQDVTWRKSRRSNSQGTCVELAILAGGTFAVRNSRHPGGPALVYTQAEIDAFIRGVKDGDFDDLLS